MDRTKKAEELLLKDVFMEERAPIKRYKLEGLFDSDLPEEQIKEKLDSMGFYMYSLKDTKERGVIIDRP